MFIVLNIFILTVLIIITIWSKYRWRSRDYFKLAQKLPSNKWHTLFGWGPMLRGKEIFSYITEYGKKYGKNCILWSGPYSFYISSEPQVIKEILLSDNCLERPYIVYKGVIIKGGNGLITENEPSWNGHRKLFNKAFSHKILMSYIPIFVKESNNLISEIDLTMTEGREMDLWMLFQESTLKISTATILKRDLESSEFKSKIMSKYLHELFDYLAELCSNQLLNHKWLRELAEIFIYKTAAKGAKLFYGLIDQSLDIYEKNDLTNRSYILELKSSLDLAFQGVQQNVLEKQEITGQMIHLFTASFETTSSTLFMVITLLAMHPKYQEQAYEEIINILSKNNEIDTDITIEKLDELIFLDMIINETLRLLPIVPLVSRKVGNMKMDLSNGLTLPAGQHIFIDIYRLHRCKDIWGPKADHFNPDNFLPHNINSKHPFSFIPFTKGPRICIGWRYAMIFAKISLAKLIKTYKFSTDFKYEDLILQSQITITFKENPKITMERRK